LLNTLKTFLSPARLIQTSLLLVGLMWVLPFLHFRHQYPLTTFYQEWWAAMLGLLAMFPLVASGYWQKPQIPRIVQLPIGLIAVIVLQYALAKIAYFDQAMLYVLYLLFALLLMMLGACLRDAIGMAQLSLVLAICLLTGAELSALVGVLQHYQWNTPLNPVVVMKVSAGVFGNLAQPNHFADYIALGLISLGLLQQRLKTGYVIVLAAPLLFVLLLSGSRSAWLYLLFVAGLSWWWARRDTTQRSMLRYSLWLLAGFGAMHLVVQLPFMAGAGSNFDTVQRLVDDASGGIRLHLWHESLLMFSQSPWVGVGIGQFALQHFQLLPQLPPNNILGLYSNAHNLIFHLAVEMGVLGLLVFIPAVGLWLYGAYRAIHQTAKTKDPSANPGIGHWWGYAILGVLLIHSLLEYPLWYIYFIGIAAVLLGALDETRYSLELRNVGRFSLSAVLVLGLATMLQLSNNYHKLEQILAIRPVSATDYGVLDRMRLGLIDMHSRSLFAPYAELFMSSMIEINRDNLKEKLELNERVMRFAPIGMVVYRETLLLAQDGRLEQAKMLLQQAVRSYPDEFPVAYRQMTELAFKDPAHFSALLEFALEKK
jgi:O-antigen ligase